MGKTIRVLQVLGSLNMGGAETMIMNLYRKIDKKKFQFDFIVHGDDIGVYEEEIKKLGGKIYRMPKYKLYNHFSYKKAWTKFFKTHKEYKIIHGHMRSTASIYLKIAKKYKLVTLSHSHNTSNGRGFSSIVKYLFQLKIRKIADYLLACSYDSAVWLYGKKCASSEKCFIINNAIDVDNFVFNIETRDKIRKQFNLENKFVIGQVGRLATTKNHMFTLDLFKDYLLVNKDAFLMLIGDGPLENEIEGYIKKHNLEDKVIMLKNRSDINELMQAMDLFIMPSIYEGLPLTLVEAQSASLPCVISSNISAGFLIDSLIHKNSLDASKDSWIELIEKNKNEIRCDRRKEISKQGFDIKTNVKWLEKFYYKLNK